MLDDDPIIITADQRCVFYKFQKQAAIGDVNIIRPQILEAGQMWDAWKTVEGMGPDQAKQKYIEEFHKFFDGISKTTKTKWLSGAKLRPNIKANLAMLVKFLYIIS